MNSLVLRENNIDKYVAEIRKYPLLDREQEHALAVRFRDEGDVQAAHTLVVSNLRFVVKVAHEFRGYSVKLLDLIQEGNVGLMQAVKKFDPDRGYRLISYAVWWIRAYMKSFVMRTFSQVKLGTTQAARKLFFTLRSAKNQLKGADGTAPSPDELAKELGVEVSDIEEMELRMAARDFSIDAELPEGGVSRVELMPAPNADQEAELGEREEQALLHQGVSQAMAQLSDKERYIVEQRYLGDESRTLQDLGEELGVSRERVRQLESRALKKLRGFLPAPKSDIAA